MAAQNPFWLKNAVNVSSSRGRKVPMRVLLKPRRWPQMRLKRRHKCPMVCQKPSKKSVWQRLQKPKPAPLKKPNRRRLTPSAAPRKIRAALKKKPNAKPKMRAALKKKPARPKPNRQVMRPRVPTVRPNRQCVAHRKMISAAKKRKSARPPISVAANAVAAPAS